MKKCEIEGGATLWARQTVDSEIFEDKPDKWFKIWFYLVNRVSHKDTRKYKRGETFYQQEWICEKTKASPDQLKKCLAWLRDSGMISTRRSTRGTWLKIPKYSYFQTLDNYYYNVKAPDKAREKHERSTKEARRYNKNDKNDKNDNNSDVKTSREIDQIMKIFYKINPTLNWGNKTTRKACADMIKRFGPENTIAMSEQVTKVQGEKYAPTATTPYQMKEKLAQFKVYFDRQRANKPKFTKVS